MEQFDLLAFITYGTSLKDNFGTLSATLLLHNQGRSCMGCWRWATPPTWTYGI